MIIPDDVVQAANRRYYSHSPIITRHDADQAHGDAYLVVAEWARKEALSEFVRDLREITDGGTE